MEIVLDGKTIKVRPFYLIYEVDGKEETELSVRIDNKEDRDYVFTHCIRNKMLERRKNG